METWMKLVLLLGLALSVAGAKGHVCSIDEPDQSKLHSYRLIVESVEPCFKSAVTGEMMGNLKGAMTLEAVQKFFKDFCPNHARVIACMAEVRSNLSTCRNKEVSVPLMILGHLTEHLLASDCGLDGQRLAFVAHKVMLVTRKRDQLLPLMQCYHKTNAFLNLATEANIDLASETYLLYKEAPKYKRCLKYVEDEAYKPALEWIVDETVSVLKCQHPKEDKLVLCSSMDSREVPITDICDVKPLNEPDLYDHLQDMAIGCYTPSFSLDLMQGVNVTDLEWLKEAYKSRCVHRDRLGCLLEKAAYAEGCLSREDGEQFQLFLESVDEVIQQSCVEDGAKIASIMHEVYRRTPEKGHAIRNCYHSVSEASLFNQGHRVMTKSMRFYHDVIAFKRCVVEKLHSKEDVVKEVDTMINNVLKKMKCVHPKGGSIVLCEAIHFR